MKGRFLTVAAGLLSLLALQTGTTRAATGQHVHHGRFVLDGERGSFGVAVAFPSFRKRSWDVVNSDFGPGRFGQYKRMAAGHGKHVEAGGHASAWYARLVGFVIPNEGRRSA